MKGLAELRILFDQRANRLGIGAVDPEVAGPSRAGLMAVDAEGFGHTFLLVQVGQSGGLVYAILGHVPIGRPLAPGDGEQSALIDVDGVVARQRGGVVAVAGFHERTNAGESAENVRAGWLLVEVECGSREDELDLL